MNVVPAYAVITRPKARPPPVDTHLALAYEQACIDLLYACFNYLPEHEITSRARRMRDAKWLLERR